MGARVRRVPGRYVAIGLSVFVVAAAFGAWVIHVRNLEARAFARDALEAETVRDAGP